ncbi:antibiotic biosynthesis monooxygenase family protein [Achromobacter aloeverae]|uniref:Antibiotic biosynthesis monooxygenase n=1 Tax=Achromobacter aloeverae TaxID=1750518 RepID=A0A4V1MRM8_9BURK|nr:antibiotic biosynthesis monooxygenase [Achromobacter aloeverae]RXN85191.1 antibiotic biosynthesis monooxygenase [Achromobacter aloeverae]
MYSVLFEVQPKQERYADYLRLASTLKPRVDRRVDGLIDNERFEDTRRPGWLLSHSLWRDEKAVTRWQATVEHHAAQAHGRAAIFANYHVRVGDVCYDSHPPSRAAIPFQDRAGRLVRADPATRIGRWATLTELDGGEQAADASWREQLPLRLGLPLGSADLLDYSVFASIYTPGKLAVLVSWASHGAAAAWRPLLADAPAPRHRAVRIVRDHGMHDGQGGPGERHAEPSGAPSLPRQEPSDG